VVGITDPRDKNYNCIKIKKEFLVLKKRFAYPTLSELIDNADIPTYDTGKVNERYQKLGIHVNDIEAQYATINMDGEIVFQTGVEFPNYVYRGQNQDFIPCIPSIARLKSDKEKFLAFCRNIAFEDALDEHPYVKFCKEQCMNGIPLHINKQALAQHYGLHTNMLDVTSNFYVACFFASCYWDKKSKSYLPIKKSNDLGVIYRANPIYFMRDLRKNTFNFVGWQPLTRPAQQRAGSFTLHKGDCFASLPGIQKILFKHDEKSSRKIWEMFNQGKNLFPDDPASKLSIHANELSLFTKEQISRAWRSLEIWEGREFSKRSKKYIQRKSKVKLSLIKPLSWKSFNITSNRNRNEEKMNKDLNNIKLRMVYKG